MKSTTQWDEVKQKIKINLLKCNEHTCGSFYSCIIMQRLNDDHEKTYPNKNNDSY